MTARLMPRILCSGCLEQLCSDVKLSESSSLSVWEAITRFPSASFRLRDNSNNLGGSFDLHEAWEESGLFQAFTNHLVEAKTSGMHRKGSPVGAADLRSGYNPTLAASGKNIEYSCRVCARELSKEARKVCSRCKKVTYCSHQCQKTDWRRHKKVECVSAKEWAVA